MNCKILQTCNYLLVAALCLVSGTGFGWAKDASTVSGSYRIVQKTHLGPQTRVRLQIRLTNHGQHKLRIQRLTFWDFSHPVKGGTQACSILVRGHASADTATEFTIPRAEYEMWRRGTRPRLVVELQRDDGRRATQAVRLDQIPAGRGN